MKDDARRLQIYFKVNDTTHSALVQYLGRMKRLKRKDVVMRWILQGWAREQRAEQRKAKRVPSPVARPAGHPRPASASGGSDDALSLMKKITFPPPPSQR
ncbi:MAG: hypothetical protein AAB433_02690 [Nitrospirota bacterium]